MALFVYVTDNCTKQFHKHHTGDAVETLAKRVETAQKLSGFDPFPASYHVKKQFHGRKGRLIGRLHAVNVDKQAGDDGEHIVLVLLSFMIRSDPAYHTQFSKGAAVFGAQHFDHLVSQETLTVWVKERLKVNPPPEMPAPGEQEYGYLHQVLQRHQPGTGEKAEESLCESREWVERCGKKPFKEWLPNLYQAIWAAEWHNAPGGELVDVPNKPDWAILVRYFPTKRMLMLVAPVVKSDTKTLTEIRGRYADLLDETEPEMDLILNRSRRAYPSQVLEDDELWMELEKDDEANMALSPEEMQLLESARTAGGGYPLFINGRAGSGKTTILQYLFADYLYYHITVGGVSHPPVYFTCNAELLQRSHRTVTRLLRCHAKWWKDKGREQLVEGKQASIEEAFKEFHRHLLSLVPGTERVQRFAAGKYVNYARFKQLWEENFSCDPAARRNYGPDISWHILRSYIKGLSSEDYIDPDEYQQLPTNQITVTQKTYETVYYKVWEGWYEELCKEEQLWDDQDLARHLIENELVEAVYPAIFCDESQDFTRIELEVILRMSLFSERKIGREEVNLVPFVFAGDEFQTLNPTGFRWDTVKAFFVEKFILGLAQHQPRKVELNYQELTFNYRSSRSIVRFSNLIQALRARLFDLTGLKPQKPWEHDHNPPPVTRFQRENGEFWEKLKMETDVALIVPCAEGEEVSFIENDEVLKQKVKVVNGVPQMLVLSANRAKGLEFPRVVVYGFGAEAPAGVLDPLQGKEPYAGNPDRSLPYQYFINRLYVAVSRPKRRLFIVDSKESLAGFWSFAHESAQMNAVLGGLKHGHDVWGESLAQMEMGNPNDLAHDRATDPLENAKNLARDGRARRDAYLLDQAAVSFKNANEKIEATRCTADARRIQCRFIEAGDLYLTCQSTRPAVECYWEDGREGSREGWEKLVAVAASHPDVMQSVEYKLARGLTDKLTMAVATDLLQMLGDRLGGEETRAELISSSAWTAAVRALVEAVLKLETTVAAEWARVAQLTTKLADAGLSISPAARAMLHFRAQELGRAVELWNQGQPNDRNSHEYRVAKAYSAQYPDKLTALSDLGKFDDVIAAYDANPTVKLSRDQAHAVGRAFSARGNYEGALPHLVEAYDGQGLADIVVGAYAGQSELALRATIALFAVTAANARWTDMLPYLEGKSLPVVRRTADGLRAWMSRNQRHLDLELMRTLARSESLGDIKWDARGELLKLRTFAEYLKKRLFTNERPNVGAANLAELGAAVERTGDRVYALQYYEKLSADESLNADLRQQARERWVICKERQARFMEKDGDTNRATKAYAEARDRRKTLGMKPDDRILEYPEISSLANYLTAVLSMPLEQSQPQLPPPASAPEPMAPQPAITEERSTAIHSLEGGIVPAKDHANESASPTSVTDAPNTPTEPQRGNICGCVFEFFRQDGRLNINGENGITLAIRLPKKTCASADLTVTADGENSKRFTVEEWNLVVDLTHNEAVVLEFVDEQLELRFKLD